MARRAVWWPARIARPPTSESMPLPPAAHDIAERLAPAPDRGFRLVMLGLGMSVVELEMAASRSAVKRVICEFRHLHGCSGVSSSSELCGLGHADTSVPLMGGGL